jgi:hypothetical protein
MREFRRRLHHLAAAFVHHTGSRVRVLLDAVLPDVDDLASDPRRPAEQIAVAIISWARAMTVAGVALALLAALVVGAKAVVGAG